MIIGGYFAEGVELRPEGVALVFQKPDFLIVEFLVLAVLEDEVFSEFQELVSLDLDQAQLKPELSLIFPCY